VVHKDKYEKWFTWLAVANLWYCVFVILWGAFVRATGSGAGCGAHWPLCNGVMLPRAPVLETIIEMTHRLTSGVLLIMALAMLILSFRVFPKGHASRLWVKISFGFLIFEALIGAALVLLELVGDNDSKARAIAIGGHLANTMILVGALTINLWLVKGKSLPKNLWKGVHFRLIGPLLVLMILLGVTGAIVALGDTLFPASSLKEGALMGLDSTAHFLIQLRFIHPLLAMFTGLYCMVVANWLLSNLKPGIASQKTKRMILLILIQLGVGVLNMFLLVPIWTQMLHLFLANVLWIIIIDAWVTASAELESQKRLDPV
jgi:cytochrome c oxidase assembly protein subunit 15